jgi:hypothetical protein
MLNYVKYVAAKKGMTTNFFSPLSFAAVFGSGINIPDPQHCREVNPTVLLIGGLQVKVW